MFRSKRHHDESGVPAELLHQSVFEHEFVVYFVFSTFLLFQILYEYS